MLLNKWIESGFKGIYLKESAQDVSDENAKCDDDHPTGCQGTCKKHAQYSSGFIVFWSYFLLMIKIKNLSKKIFVLQLYFVRIILINSTLLGEKGKIRIQMWISTCG